MDAGVADMFGKEVLDAITAEGRIARTCTIGTLVLTMVEKLTHKGPIEVGQGQCRGGFPSEFLGKSRYQ